MDLDATKPVFGVSDKVRLKPVSSATETSWKIEISPVASLDMILSKGADYDKSARMRRLVCVFVVHNNQRQVTSLQGPYKPFTIQ